MTASLDYVVVADKVRCVASDDTFEIHFSRGYRAVHLAVSIWLVCLGGFLALTVFAAFRHHIAFDDWWGWLPLAFCNLAAIAHRFFTQGFTRAPIRIDRAGRVRCGYQRMRFRTRPTASLIGPASEIGRPVDTRRLRGKSGVVLVGAGGTRVMIFKTKNHARAHGVAESLAVWLGQTARQALKPNGDARLARCLTIMCVVNVIASLYMAWTDHPIFHPVHMGTLALISTAGLTPALLLLCAVRLWNRWHDRSVMVTAKDRVIQSAAALLRVAAVSATIFHFANLVELRSTPMQSRTSRTVIGAVGPAKKGCQLPLYFIEPRLGRLAVFCPMDGAQKWAVGQVVLLDEKVNAFGVRVVGVSVLRDGALAPKQGGSEKEQRQLGRCSWR